MKCPKPRKRLDKWLARHVMGWKWELRYFAAYDDPADVSEAYMWVDSKDKIKADVDWSPTSYILEAFEIVDKLFEMGYDFELECFQNAEFGAVERQTSRAIFRKIDKQQDVAVCYAESREEAICEAARKVIENKGKTEEL